MAGDEDKKKKKKKEKKEKKDEEAAPPELQPEPAKPSAAAADEGGFDWMSEATEAPAPVEGEVPPPVEGEEVVAPIEGEAPVDGEVAEPPPAPKKKPKFFVHWNRRKARFYDYNFDYGENYYSSMVRYVDNKNAGLEVPRRMAFAERGMYSSLARKAVPDNRTSNLLNDVRVSIRNLETSQRTYMWEHKKVA